MAIAGPKNRVGADGKPGADGKDGLRGPKGLDGKDGLQGPRGNSGGQGNEGPPGVGVPVGGSTGQVLKKNSNSNYDTTWSEDVGGAAWGGITGTLSAQTDLQTALDDKADIAHRHMVGDLNQSGASAGQLLVFDGLSWSPTWIPDPSHFDLSDIGTLSHAQLEAGIDTTLAAKKIFWADQAVSDYVLINPTIDALVVGSDGSFGFANGTITPPWVFSSSGRLTAQDGFSFGVIGGSGSTMSFDGYNSYEMNFQGPGFWQNPGWTLGDSLAGVNIADGSAGFQSLKIGPTGEHSFSSTGPLSIGNGIFSIDAWGDTYFYGAENEMAGNLVVKGQGINAVLQVASGDQLGFHSATPTVKRSGAAQDAVATTGATNITPFGFTTAAQANALVTLVNELRASLVQKGIIKGSV